MSCSSASDCNTSLDNRFLECVFGIDPNNGTCVCSPLFYWEGIETGCTTPSTLLQLDRVILFVPIFISFIVILLFIYMLKEAINLANTTDKVDWRFPLLILLQLLSTLCFFWCVTLFQIEAFTPDRFIIEDFDGFSKELVITEYTIPAYQLLSIAVILTVFAVLCTVLNWFKVLESIESLSSDSIRLERLLVRFLLIFIPLTAFVLILIVATQQLIALLIFLPFTATIIIGIYIYMARSFLRPLELAMKSTRKITGTSSFSKGYLFVRKANRIFTILFLIVAIDVIIYMGLGFYYIVNRQQNVKGVAFIRCTFFLLLTTYVCASTWYTKTLLANNNSSCRS